jgi:hypothetical protein
MHVFTEATMHAHNLFINECDQWHVVEAIIEKLPECNFVASLDLVEESINAGNSLTLVVTTQDNDLLGISHLQGEQETNDLTALFTSVNVISHEEVPGILRNNVILLFLLVFVSHFFEHVKKVGVLSVNITKDLDWGLKLHKWLLIFKAFLNLLNQEFNHLVWEVNEWNAFWVLASVTNNIMVKVVNNDIHDEGELVVEVFLGNIANSFLELLTPLFLNVERFHVVLLGLQIFIEQTLKLLSVLLLSKALFINAWHKFKVVLWDSVFLLVGLGSS